MRQTLTLVGILQSILRGERRGAADARYFQAQFVVREDPPATSSPRPIEAIVFEAQCPGHAAILEACPGDRVEIVGHWHGFDSYDADGDLVPIQLFYVERFRVVGS